MSAPITNASIDDARNHALLIEKIERVFWESRKLLGNNDIFSKVFGFMNFWVVWFGPSFIRSLIENGITEDNDVFLATKSATSDLEKLSYINPKNQGQVTILGEKEHYIRSVP